MKLLKLRTLNLILISISMTSAQAKLSCDIKDEFGLIYGADNRYESEEYPNVDFVKKSHSVAMRVPNKRLNENRENPNIINFNKRLLKNAMGNLCADERFIDQYTLGDCSGFLISNKLLLTAGHCMSNQEECEKFKWVFDFKNDSKEFDKKNVYSCKKIIDQKYNYSKWTVQDYAIIELDRAVQDRESLSIRRVGIIPRGTEVVVIGHPLGLPMKTTDGAEVMRMNDQESEQKLHSIIQRRNYFTTNLDSYAGNSGSPVFNKRTGKVEGILIQGADDFTFNYEKGCLESQHNDNSYHTAYEKVMRITKIPGL